MTPHQIALIQGSFAHVAMDVDGAAASFYGQLFKIAPEVRPLFKNDIVSQGQKLLQTIAVVVDALPRLHELLPTVHELARRHVAYGTREAHYSVVGSALIFMLRDRLGDAFDAETERAWGAAYTVLASEMIQAAHKKAA